MRDYQRSHPFLEFKPFYITSPSLALLLGEIKSKCEHLSGVPLPPAIQQEMLKVYLAQGISATTAIEGNSLSEQEVFDFIQGKLSLSVSKEYLGHEIKNILLAYNEVTEKVIQSGGDYKIEPALLMEYNARILKGLPLQDHVAPGVLRKIAIYAGHYKAPHHEDCPYLIEQYCEWLHQAFKPDLVNGVIKAILAHLYFVLIHPFTDGNGRTARLLEVQILLASGLPNVASHLLSNHYNKTRSEYYRHLTAASTKEGGIEGFVEYALQGFSDALKEQIAVVKRSQVEIVWENTLHNHFKKARGSGKARLKELILTLSSRKAPSTLLRAEILSIILSLNPDLFAQYQAKTPRLVERDLRQLAHEGLLILGVEHVELNKGMILSFVPVSIQRASIIAEQLQL
jgi:Fic family protein